MSRKQRMKYQTGWIAPRIRQAGMLVLAPADPRYDLCAGQPGLTEKFCKGSEHKQAQSSHHQHEVARMGSARCCNIIYQGMPQAWHDTNTAKCSQFLTAQLGKQDMAVTGLLFGAAPAVARSRRLFAEKMHTHARSYTRP